jgi:DNA-binding response OmpR family regulator
VLLRGDSDEDFVEKPFTAEELGGRIREILGAGA